MSSILLKKIFLDGKICDVFIEGNRFRSIAPELNITADHVIDGGGHKALTPAFYNTHTHAGMTLLRGYADDMDLYTWLNDYIWPAEAKMTEEDVYHGTRLAILEMIRSGTVFFNDMYGGQFEVIRAVEEMGIRAAVGALYFTDSHGKILERNRKKNAILLEHRNDYSDRVQITLAPHAIYTVAEPVLRSVATKAQEMGLMVHIHASETLREVEECMAAHGGMTPIQYLDSLELLGRQTIVAHCTHLSNEDIELLATRQAVIAHMPCSNMKLVSGQFRYHSAVDQAHCRLTLGTDGCSSNNNLSMLDEMKFAALSAKIESGIPTAAKDSDVFLAATQRGAEAFGIDAGVIAEGKLADCLLVELNAPCMIGDFNLVANLVYSADTSVIDTVICNGRVLMENRHIDGEQEILDAARACCRKIGGMR